MTVSLINVLVIEEMFYNQRYCKEPLLPRALAYTVLCKIKTSNYSGHNFPRLYEHHLQNISLISSFHAPWITYIPYLSLAHEHDIHLRNEAGQREELWEVKHLSRTPLHLKTFLESGMRH